MSNLEELILYLSIIRTELTYIDGTHLYDEILIDTIKRIYFQYKHSCFQQDIRINLPSNNDIQHSFIRRGYQQIGSYTHNKSTTKKEAHVISII
jgi:hypothetical protein